MAPSSSASTPTSAAAETASRLKSLLREVHNNDKADAIRLDELRKLFASLHASGELQLSSTSFTSTTTENQKGNGSSGVKEKWSAYLKKHHNTFLTQLSNRIRQNKKSALRTYCGVIASTPISLTPPPATAAGGGGDSTTVMKKKAERINESLLYRLLESLINPHDGEGEKENDDGIMDEAMLQQFVNEFVRLYHDVQYFTLVSVKNVASDLYDEHKRWRKQQQLQQSYPRKAEDETEGEEGGSKYEEEDDGMKRKADNLMRILIHIEIAENDDELQQGESAKFLIEPPESWSGDDAEEEGSDREDKEEDDDDSDQDNSSEDDDSSTTSDDDDDDEPDNSNKRNKASTSSHSNNTNKRIKRSNKISYQRHTSHKRVLTNAYLSLLRLPLPPHSQRKVLQLLPTKLIPYMSNPLVLAEYYTQSYNLGGITSILALNGLFTLMTQYRLEHSQFYKQLYTILKPQVFYSKHRSRFFDLVTKCLAGNVMMPAYVIASFCKRLCRCALVVPPSGGLFALALTSNLLRRHGEVGCLVHRMGGGGGVDGRDDGRLVDVYDGEVDDPAKSRALESSLWELNALSKHYHPAVSTMARSVGTESDTTPYYDMNEFGVHTYKSLFEQEKKRGAIVDNNTNMSKKKRKKVPLTFVKPKSLFVGGTQEEEGKEDVFSGMLSLVPPG